MSEQRFDSVWDALKDSPNDAANMKALSALMIAIRDVVDNWGSHKLKPPNASA